MSIDAMKLALEALEKFAKGEASYIPVTALTNGLRLAIEQAEKTKPDPCKDGSCDCCWTHLDEQAEKQEPVAKSHGVRFDSALHENLTVPPQQERQEPVFYGFIHENECRVEMCFTPSVPRADGTYATAFYTAPPQRQPLTAEEIDEILLYEHHAATAWHTFARAIERKHGIGGGE